MAASPVFKKIVSIPRIALNKLRHHAYMWGGVFAFSYKLQNLFLYIKAISGRLSDGIYTFKYRTGVQVLFRPNTYDVLFNLEIFGYEAYPLDLDNINLVIDLGAQIGIFSLYVASKYPSAKIIAVEATSENYGILQKNIALNKMDSRITALHNAVWNTSGDTVTMYINNFNNGRHSAIESHNRNTVSSSEKVVTISLNDLVSDQRCDVLKIDIEGAEYKVLYAAGRDTLSRIGCIVMEIHGTETQNSELESFLSGHNFLVNRKGPYLSAKNTAYRSQNSVL